MTSTPTVARAIELLRQAKRVVALTGAGISTPSGIPDFRSPESGVWDDVDPMEVASIYAFRHNPALFFDWLRPLATTILTAQPNPEDPAVVANARKRLSETPGITGSSELDVVVDGVVLPQKLSPTAGAADYPLTTGLAPGPHQIELYRRTEASDGVTQFLGFSRTLARLAGMCN